MRPPIVELPGADEATNRAAEQLIAECAIAVAHLLNSRRRGAKVGTLRENGAMQLVAVGAVYERILEVYRARYGDEQVVEIRALALDVAALITRPPA